MNFYRDKMKWECGLEYFCLLYFLFLIIMRMIGWGGDIFWIFEVGWEEWFGLLFIFDLFRNLGVGSLRVIFVFKCGGKEVKNDIEEFMFFLNLGKVIVFSRESKCF